MHSSVVKDTSPSKTMECDDGVYSQCSVVKVVNDKAKSVVPCGSETLKTGNSLKSDTVKTENVVKMIRTLLRLQTQLRLARTRETL